MSANLIIAVWTHYPESGAKLQALQAIAEAANEQGNCCLRIELLAGAARLSRRTMQRAVNALREDRWIVVSRMLGQGARLVYQLNLPLLRRSVRRNHDEMAVHAQRVRALGSTEAGLVKRVSLRGAERQDGTANEQGVTLAQQVGRQDVTCQDGTANGVERAQDALEETALSRQENCAAVAAVFEGGQLGGGMEIYYPQRPMLMPGEGEHLIYGLRTPEQVASHFHGLEDDSQGTEVPPAASGSLYGAPTQPEDAVFAPDEGFEEFEEDLAALRAAAERSAKQTAFVPRAVRS